MSWLRLDDSFPQHPKFKGWHPARKWALIELLSYCARYKTEGKVPQDYSLLPRAVTPELIALAERSGWLERTGNDELVVHDWAVYNPRDVTAASRAQAYRDRNAARAKNRDFDRDENVTSRARIPSPNNPSPKQGLLGDGRSEETDDATPATPNGAAPLIDRLRSLAERDWDQYPDKTILVTELVDRGLNEPQALELVAQLASRP